MDYVTAHDVEIPCLGLGTWRLRGTSCTSVVADALDMGYRHIDSAQMYGNEAEVGQAVRQSGVDREDVFVVTKIKRGNLAPDDVRRSFEASMQRLDTGYVDLLLIHWPSMTVPISRTIRAMNELQEDGTVRHIGVSNFSSAQMKEAADASATPILTNQVQYHPLREANDVLEFCIEHDWMLTAYSPLAKGRLLGNRTLEEIGRRHQKTSAQVALRWLIQQPQVAAIPKASSREHLEENLNIFDFRLSDDEMRAIMELRSGPIGKLRDLLRM